MANEKISELPTVTPVQPTDLLPIVRGGQNFAVRAGDIAVEAVAAAAGTSTISTGTAFFSNSNNVSVGASNQTITFSASFPTSAGYYVTGNTVGQSSTSSVNNQTLSISAAGLISAGFSNGELLLSATSAAQTQQPMAYSGSNTSSTANTLSFGNSNGLSHYITNGSLVGSYTVPVTAGLLSNIAVSGSNTSQTLTGLTFSDSNNVSFGLSSGTITASASYAAGPNYTINGGATTGTLALVSSGTLSLAGIGNITLSQVGNAITISGGSAVTNPSPIEVTAANGGSVNAATLQFNNGSGVTFGLSTGGGIATLTASVLSQTNQSIGVFASSQTFGTSSSTVDARSVTVVGQGLVSVGMSAGSLVLSATSAAQTNQTAGIYASSQTVGTSSSTYDARSLSIVGKGELSVGWSNGSLLLSSPVQSVGVSGGNTSGTSGTFSGQVVLAGGNNITLSAATAAGGNQSITISAPNAQTGISGIAVSNSTFTSGTVTLSNSNGITFGSAGANIITASYNSTQFAGTANNTFFGTNCFGTIALNSSGLTLSVSALAAGGASSGDIYLAGNTILTSSSSYIQTSQNISFAGIISGGWSSNSLIISAPASTSFPLITDISAGTLSATNLQQLVFSNSNGVSFGLNGSTITASAAGGGGGVNAGVSNLGNTAGSTGTVSTGNVVFVGSGPISLSQSTGAAGSAATITILGPATSSLVGTSGLSVSVNGSTLSILDIAASRYMWPPQQLSAISAFGNGSVSVQYMQVDEAVVASRLDVPFAWSAGESNTTNTMGIAMTVHAGVYTRANSTALSSVYGGSTQTTYTYASNTAGNTQLQTNAIRPVSCPINVSLTQGEYWVAYCLSTAFTSVGLSTTNITQAISVYGGAIQSGLNWNEFTAATNSTTNMFGGMGVYSAATASSLTSLGMANIVQSGASLSQANIGLVFRNY
jgi:hypothetical protein